MIGADQGPSERVVGRKEGAIGWLVFNNPAKHNAISMDMAEAVPAVMRGFEEDSEVRVIVVAGAGEKAFAAGSDISGFESVRADPQKNKALQRRQRALVQRGLRCTKPTVAMIRGYCIGGGLDFATSCDVRFCSDNAVFAVPAGKLGLGYGHEGILRFGRVMGFMRARDLFLSGRRLGAEEALRLGLVHRVIPLCGTRSRNDGLCADHRRQCAADARRDQARVSRIRKRSGIARSVRSAQAMIDACFRSADYTEGRTAFAAKRKPKFTGK